MLKRVAIGKLRPNPFRRLDEYPIRREKVDALKKSIGTTGFWGTIVGREVEGGFVEIAFGHHRLVAIHEALGREESVEIIVRDLSNEDMLRMMASENMEEWGALGWVELETIRATIEAADKGLITLPDVGERGPRRKTSQNAVTFSRGAVAQFLGWTRKANGDRNPQPNFACEVAFKALDAIDDGLVNEKDLMNLTRGQIYNLVATLRGVQNSEEKVARANREQAEEAKKRAAEARDQEERRRLEQQASIYEEQARNHEEAGKHKAASFAREATEILLDEDGGGVREIRRRADEIKVSAPRDAKVHTADDFFEKFAGKLENVLRDGGELDKDIEFATLCVGDASPEAVAMVRQSAKALIWRIEQKVLSAFDPT